MGADASHQKTLFRVVILGTAISFGILGAVVVSMKDFVGGDAAFEFSWKTIAGFAVGAACGWAFWRVIGWLSRRNSGRDRN